MSDRRQIELPDGDLIRVPRGMRSWAIDQFLDEWTAAVDRERGSRADDEQLIDYDLLADVIAEACPDLMTDEGSRWVAERALARLAGMDGVTVVRGPDSKPWTPEPVAVDAPICCEHAQ